MLNAKQRDSDSSGERRRHGGSVVLRVVGVVGMVVALGAGCVAPQDTADTEPAPQDTADTEPAPPATSSDVEPVGSPSPLRIWTHCGIEAAEIDGQLFVVDIDNPPLMPLNSEYTWGNPFEDGTYVPQSDGSVIFTGQGGLVQRFVPAAGDYE